MDRNSFFQEGAGLGGAQPVRAYLPCCAQAAVDSRPNSFLTGVFRSPLKSSGLPAASGFSPSPAGRVAAAWNRCAHTPPRSVLMQSPHPLDTPFCVPSSESVLSLSSASRPEWHISDDSLWRLPIHPGCVVSPFALQLHIVHERLPVIPSYFVELIMASSASPFGFAARVTLFLRQR